MVKSENNLSRIFSKFDGKTATVNLKGLKELVEAGKVKGEIKLYDGGREEAGKKVADVEK